MWLGQGLNHTPFACVDQWPRYEVTTSMWSGMNKLATTICSVALFPIAFCSGVYFTHWLRFLLLFDLTVERTSELEDIINVNEELLAISHHLEVQK